MRFLKNHYFWIVAMAITLVSMFSIRDFDNRSQRSIIGDAKGYYAYLPAIFIHQDASFSFIYKVEKKYYPEDNHQFKHFLNEQENGKHVNKTFPGLALLYAPFFFISMILAWIFGFAVDGYSAPFQWGIALSHFIYFFFGLKLLLGTLRKINIPDHISYLVFTIILLCTNAWFYIVYDHTVSHIHNFFLACLFIWLITKWIQTQRHNHLGWASIILSVIIITRPTNGIMLLFIPFIARLNHITIKELFKWNYLKFKKLVPYFIIAVLIFFIPFALWKWQSDLWIVYSYNDEGFNFAHPELWNFLFSYEKGWFTWTPIIFLGLIFSTYKLAKHSISLAIYYFLPILIITYILASWWCWTYGTGFGQRPVIEYLPFIGIGIAWSLNNVSKWKWSIPIVVFFSCLSLSQGYQIIHGILKGGETTKEKYWSHLFNWERDSPTIKIYPGFKKVYQDSITTTATLTGEVQFAHLLETPPLDSIRKLTARIVIRSIGKTGGTQVVFSSSNDDFYQSYYLELYLKEENQVMEFEVDPPLLQNQKFRCYLWNGDTDAVAIIDSLEFTAYKY